ncbi:MAG: nitrile hydratase accessory protein [Steroidobacteraceae bacterium]
MTPPDGIADAAESTTPEFIEPWQARAFALAILASKQGCFTWSEWSRALGRELRASSDTGAPIGEASYFDCWLSALQSLLLGKGAIGQAELSDRERAWADAYRRTPHGTPVSLADRQARVMR